MSEAEIKDSWEVLVWASKVITINKFCWKVMVLTVIHTKVLPYSNPAYGGKAIYIYIYGDFTVNEDLKLSI